MNNQSSEKNLEIERLRGIAVLMVIVVHSSFLTAHLPAMFVLSWVGVDLFFVISGFVVTISFLKLLPTFSSSTNYSKRVEMSLTALKTFYLKRVFRILPAAFFWILIYLGLSIFCGQQAPHLFGTPLHLLKEAIYFLSGFYNYIKYVGDVDIAHLGHYWSLTVEEHFYFILPWILIIFYTKAARIQAVLGAILLVVCVLRPFIEPAAGMNVTAFNMFTSHRRFDTLLLGVLLALILRHNLHSPASANLSNTKSVSHILTNLLTLILTVVLWISPAMLPGQMQAGFGYTIYGLFALGLVYLASFQRGYVFELPYLKSFLEYVGSRSYAAYLSHGVFTALQIRMTDVFASSIPEWVMTSASGATLRFTIMLGFILLASDLTFRLIEQPMIRYGKRVIKAA